jgi:hypothetical protein
MKQCTLYHWLQASLKGAPDLNGRRESKDWALPIAFETGRVPVANRLAGAGCTEGVTHDN